MELVRTADRVRRYFTALYEPHEITPQQYNVLRILRGAQPGALPTMEIAERMVEQTPGITRLVDRLENKGLVVRERPADDRRRVLISISAAGLELLDLLEDRVHAATVAVLDGLGDEEVECLNSVLLRIREQVGR
ncbi:MAG: MarR family transcriptional regulator [Gemmatimonadetes bacterium]|nr:MarR family transcriptional regulator [Gemmatimonadota bacterium]